MNNLTILDGGMGRELQEMGAPFSQPLWSAQALMEAPDLVVQAHENFINVGAEIIIANSYACVPYHLGDNLFAERGYELAELAGQLALQAKQNAAQASNSVLVAGAIPPPFGSYRPELFDLEKSQPILQTLFDAQEPNVDIWIAETICSIEEFHGIYEVLKQTDKKCYYAFSLSDEQSGQARLRSGQSVSEVIEQVCKFDIAGILFNCSIPEVMEKAIQDTVEIIKQASYSIEVGVYANNFKPISDDHEANDTLQSMRELTPQDYLSYAQRWHAMGATLIGGCCGIGPHHIEALADWKSGKV